MKAPGSNIRTGGHSHKVKLEKISMIKQPSKMDQIIGIIGMVILQSNNLPFLFHVLKGELPPSLLPFIMTFVGLSCYMARAVKMRDWLYITGNGIGMGSSLIIIILMLWG
jgi:hypothetical protein